MPTQDIPLGTKVYRNVDGMELTDEGALLMDGFLDRRLARAGANVSRPGLSLLNDIGLADGRSCQGIYWWDQRQCAIAVFDNRTYKITRAGTATTVTDLTGVTLESQSACTFAQDGTYVFIANGGRIVYTDGTALTAYIADTDAPTNCSHVAYLDGYILANNVGTQQVNYSNNEAPFTWDANHYFSAVSDGDNLTALHVFQREVYLFGPQSVEIWENDGQAPFVPVPGGILQVGCSAPLSVASTDNGVYFFDNNRRLVRFAGKSVEPLSTDYDKEIESFTSIADCRALRIKISGIPFIVFQMGNAGRTLVYNYRDDTWSEWGRWVSQAGQYERWLVDGYCYCTDWNVHLCGSRKDSKIYALSKDYIDDAGEAIRFCRETGHIDYGVHTRKRSNEITVKLKRGDTHTPISGRDRTLSIEILDDNKNQRRRTIDLGNAGENEIVVPIGRTGIYRTRKYSLVSTAPVNLIISEAKESFDILR